MIIEELTALILFLILLLQSVAVAAVLFLTVLHRLVVLVAAPTQLLIVQDLVHQARLDRVVRVVTGLHILRHTLVAVVVVQVELVQMQQVLIPQVQVV
jgi:hypothetical protein